MACSLVGQTNTRLDLAPVTLVRAMAEKGDAKAQNELGNRYYFGSDGVGQDYVQSLSWYEKAAAQGNSFAMYRLFLLYGVGHGAPQDEAKSIDWLQKAAALGHLDALTVLASYYNDGKHVPQDKGKAMELYEKAASLGSDKARAAIARLDPSPIATNYGDLTMEQTFNSIYKLNMAQPDIAYSETTTGAGANPAVVQNTFTIYSSSFSISTDAADGCTMNVSTDGGYRINFRTVGLDSVEMLPYFQYENEKTTLKSPGTNPNFYVVVARQSLEGARTNGGWHEWSILGAYLNPAVAEQAARGWIHVIRLCAGAPAGAAGISAASVSDVEEQAFQKMREKEAGAAGRTDSERAYAGQQVAKGDAYQQRLEDERQRFAQQQAIIDAGNRRVAEMKGSTAEGILNGMNTALTTANSQMAQTNAQQQAAVDAGWQQAQDLVAANNARRGTEVTSPKRTPPPSMSQPAAPTPASEATASNSSPASGPSGSNNLSSNRVPALNDCVGVQYSKDQQPEFVNHCSQKALILFFVSGKSAALTEFADPGQVDNTLLYGARVSSYYACPFPAVVRNPDGSLLKTPAQQYICTKD